jgi:hypothetical protein
MIVVLSCSSFVSRLMPKLSMARATGAEEQISQGKVSDLESKTSSSVPFLGHKIPILNELLTFETQPLAVLR